MLNPDVDGPTGGGLSNADLPKEAFTIDQVNMYWRRCANLLKEEGRETTYNAMVKRNPKLVNDVRIIMEVDNPVQIDLVNTDVDRIIAFMRSNLKNYDVFVEVKLTDNQFEDVKALTGKDRFAILARKYPNLNLLKSTFNLDIDY